MAPLESDPTGRCPDSANGPGLPEGRRGPWKGSRTQRLARTQPWQACGRSARMPGGRSSTWPDPDPWGRDREHNDLEVEWEADR